MIDTIIMAYTTQQCAGTGTSTADIAAKQPKRRQDHMPHLEEKEFLA